MPLFVFLIGVGFIVHAHATLLSIHAQLVGDDVWQAEQACHQYEILYRWILMGSGFEVEQKEEAHDP